jgi:hypothetical protein
MRELLKKSMVALLFAVSSTAITPSVAKADDSCLLRHDCFLVENTWVCPTQKIFCTLRLDLTGFTLGR